MSSQIGATTTSSDRQQDLLQKLQRLLRTKCPKGKSMPFVNVKLVDGVFTSTQKHAPKALTDCLHAQHRQRDAVERRRMASAGSRKRQAICQSASDNETEEFRHRSSKMRWPDGNPRADLAMGRFPCFFSATPVSTDEHGSLLVPVETWQWQAVSEDNERNLRPSCLARPLNSVERTNTSVVRSLSGAIRGKTERPSERSKKRFDQSELWIDRCDLAGWRNMQTLPALR